MSDQIDKLKAKVVCVDCGRALEPEELRRIWWGDGKTTIYCCSCYAVRYENYWKTGNKDGI